MRQRDRLTITLPQDTIRRIDQLIDGVNVRNRSHAVEKLLMLSLTPVVNTAVILAGGKGDRQKSPLKVIGDKYLIAIMLDQLRQHGVDQVIVCAGLELIRELGARLGDGKALGVKLVLIDEPQPLGTAGALKYISDHLPTTPFLVIHGDVLTNINFSELINFHQREAGWATIGVKPRFSENSFGRVFMQGNKIIEFLSTGSDQGISIVNTGIYVVDPQVLKIIKPNQKLMLEADVFPKLAKKELLNAFLFQGVWFDVSSIESRALATKVWTTSSKNNQD